MENGKYPQIGKYKIEVLVDFPYSIHKKGDILELNNLYFYAVRVGELSRKIYVTEYPDIYKIL